MIKRGLVLSLLVILILLLVGCSGKSSTPDQRIQQDVYSGSRGLDIKFVSNLPPSRIYDQGVIDILTELENKGASDLSGSNCYIHISGYDPSIVRGLDTEKQCGESLWGKSTSFPEGGRSSLEFKTDTIRLPEGVESLQQKFILSACYKYETLASPVVCIDPQQYKIKSITDACTVRDVSLGGGQGAPVSVSRVGVDMIGSDKVRFQIRISNVGGGTVLRRGTSISGRGGSSCPTNLDFDDYNIIDYQVQMSGGSLITCSPDKIRMVNGNAELFCTFRIKGESAYTTPLQIRLLYNYLDSVSKSVEILKTPE